MKNTSILLTVFLVMALLTVPADSQNMLVNGDFETGDLTGWTIGGPDTCPSWLGPIPLPAQVFSDASPINITETFPDRTWAPSDSYGPPPYPETGYSAGWARMGPYHWQEAAWVAQTFQVAPGTYLVNAHWDVNLMYQPEPNSLWSIGGLFYVLADDKVGAYDKNIYTIRKSAWSHESVGEWMTVSIPETQMKTTTGNIEVRFFMHDKFDTIPPLYEWAAFDNCFVEMVFVKPYIPATTIDLAKKADAGEPVNIATTLATGVFRSDDGAGNTFPDSFAIEEADRSAGIRVVWNGEVTVGDEVRVSGSAGEPQYHPGERVINATMVEILSSENKIPEAFSIAGIDTGGGAYAAQGAVVNDGAANKYAVGMNNVGILMKVVGKVTASYMANPSIPKFSDYFYVDDAYSDAVAVFDTGIKDGSGNIGIKCRPPVGLFNSVGQMPNVGDYVEVLGVMGVRQINGKNARYLWTVDWSPASFTTQTRNHIAKWSLLSLPAQPKFADPAIVFGSEIVPDPDKIDGRLYRWDAPTQSLGMYDMWSPDLFGAMNSSEGYWLNAALAGTISYTGYTESTSLDRWISAPTGWKLMGNPFTSNTQWADWKATDGTAMKSIFEASQYGDGWMQSIGYWWNDTTQSLSDLGLPDDFPQSEELKTWYGYWVKTSKNLGLVAPSSPAAF